MKRQLRQNESVYERASQMKVMPPKSADQDPKSVIVSIVVVFCLVCLLYLVVGVPREPHEKTPEERIYEYNLQLHRYGPKPPLAEEICASDDPNCKAAVRAAKCEFMPETSGCPQESPQQFRPVGPFKDKSTANKLIHLEDTSTDQNPKNDNPQ